MKLLQEVFEKILPVSLNSFIIIRNKKVNKF